MHDGRMHNRLSWILVVRSLPVALAATVASLAIATAGNATVAARPPSPLERGGIQQAIFDFFDAKGQVAHPTITRMLVSTRAAPHLPANATRYYSAFARVDLSDKKAGLATAFLGFYVEPPLSGWRVLQLGTVAVGCLPASVFRGHKVAVLRDLRLVCPGVH